MASLGGTADWQSSYVHYHGRTMQPTGAIQVLRKNTSGFSENCKTERKGRYVEPADFVKPAVGVKVQPKSHDRPSSYPAPGGAPRTYELKYDQGFGRNNKGKPDASRVVPGQKVVHPSCLPTLRKSNPVEAENSGGGPAGFSTSQGVTFVRKPCHPVGDFSGRLVCTPAHGVTQNFVTRARPVVEEALAATATINVKKEAPLGGDPADSLSHSQLQWARPPFPDMEQPVGKSGPAVKPSFLSSLRYDGFGIPPQTAPPTVHPRILRDMKRKDPIAHGTLTVPGYIGKPSSLPAQPGPNEREVTGLVKFKHTRPPNHSGYAVNMRTLPPKAWVEEGSITSTSFAMGAPSRSARAPFVRGPGDSSSGFCHSTFASKAAPSSGGRFVDCAALPPVVMARQKKAYSYLWESRPNGK